MGDLTIYGHEGAQAMNELAELVEARLAHKQPWIEDPAWVKAALKIIKPFGRSRNDLYRFAERVVEGDNKACRTIGRSCGKKSGWIAMDGK